MTHPLPDRDSRPWWEALGRHVLTVQRCTTCARLRWAPRGMCPACGGFEWRWHEVSGRGTVASWTVSHRSFQPGREAPYVVLLVRLAEASDVLMPGAWGGSADGLRVDLPVDAEFEDLPATDSGAWALLRWRPAG